MKVKRVKTRRPSRLTERWSGPNGCRSQCNSSSSRPVHSADVELGSSQGLRSHGSAGSVTKTCRRDDRAGLARCRVLYVYRAKYPPCHHRRCLSGLNAFGFIFSAVMTDTLPNAIDDRVNINCHFNKFSNCFLARYVT
ncbi:hypothetical protein GWI33_011390 [Rhynchophorus ferrugineus]|uniref:Uncharacterized protein n=1 Tax=Rhynchophorus ferrugineus TaxID=354439 RepID=A0A834ISJ8_RHYFE|nr:hypothetical protein GWI33_011390 [Rhynchophorus ferrugineus]